MKKIVILVVILVAAAASMAAPPTNSPRLPPFWAKLGLSEIQRKQASEIQAKADAEISAIRDREHEQLSKLLTPEQTVKLKELIAKRYHLPATAEASK